MQLGIESRKSITGKQLEKPGAISFWWHILLFASLDLA